MRPEFSELLRDIYPELEDNLQFVLRNKPLPFMDKSIFFWYVLNLILYFDGLAFKH